MKFHELEEAFDKFNIFSYPLQIKGIIFQPVKYETILSYSYEVECAHEPVFHTWLNS
jgi:hypothetical protein